MKTSELTGKALDWAVTKCEGFNADLREGGKWGRWGWDTDWAQGGPIIEREGINLVCWSFHSMPWKASIEGGTDAGVDLYVEYGDTPLIAAMRCYVASRLGDDIDIPKELT
jgi:hypothetical protein